MNEWSNDRAHVEGWTVAPVGNRIYAFGWEFAEQLVAEKGSWTGDETTQRAIAHVEARARAGSAYHIEALARHYFQE